MMQLMTQSHASQLLAAHRAVQKEKVLRLLAEAQLLERGEQYSAQETARTSLLQKHEHLEQRYLKKPSAQDGCVVATACHPCTSHSSTMILAFSLLTANFYAG
jgi:hypothetical protein